MDDHDHPGEGQISFLRHAPGDRSLLLVYPARPGFDALTRQSTENTSLFSQASEAFRRLAGDDRKTVLWWGGLCAASLFNIGVWLGVAWVERPHTEYRLWQLMLSGIYVSVCAFRSIFPRVDLERLCLWDTSCSAIFTGRLVATVAEMCFAVQCALFLAKLSEMTNVSYLYSLSVCIVPVVVIAQLSCWYAVLTLNHLGHAIEETLWTVMVALVAVGLTGSWFSTEGELRTFISTALVCCGGAVALMSVIDVPMYIARWRQYRGVESGYLSLWGGLKDTLVRRHSTCSWIIWRREVPWMTLYFSIGVWLSIGMTLLESMAP